mgnify:CR=1 FL=1
MIPELEFPKPITLSLKSVTTIFPFPQSADELSANAIVSTPPLPILRFKLPAPIQVAQRFDKRLLEYDVPPEEILSKDKKSLIVDNYVRWKIIDPLLFLQTVQTEPIAKTRIDDIVYSELRRELGTHFMSEIITENREIIMETVTKQSAIATKPYGIEVVDVRLKRVDLPQNNEESIYRRMQAERIRQANKFRSEGEEESQKIKASTDKDIERLESLPSVGTATSFLISNPVVSPVSKFHLSSCW